MAELTVHSLLVAGDCRDAAEQADAADEARLTCRCARFAREALFSRASQLIRGVGHLMTRERRSMR
jgi:hypothetical protein